MPGFDNNVVYSNNVDFRGASPVVGQMVSDGQLLIGSTAFPNIRAGSISVGNAMSSIVGAGTIALDTKIQFATATITSAQLKAINTSPIVLVPANGANTVITVIFATAKFLYGGSNAFDPSVNLLLTYSSGAPAITNSGELITQPAMSGTADVYTSKSGISVSSETVGRIDNVDLIVTASADFTGNVAGDNEVIVEILYWVSTLI